MKIALCYAPSEQQFIPVPPLGTAVLKSYLQEMQINVDTIDLELELWLSQGCKSSDLVALDDPSIGMDKIELSKIIEKLINYNIIGFSVMGVRQLIYVKRIVKLLRELKSCKIIIGGSFVTKENLEEVKNYVEADKVIYGEGWNELGDYIVEITGLEIKKKVIEKSNNEFHMPIADYSDINRNGYIIQQKNIYKLDYEDINYHILVGNKCCPYNCSFCRISKNTDKIKSSKKIAEEMIMLNDKFGCSNFSLICNEMNPSRKYVLDFVETLLQANKEFYWFCYLRPNNLNLEDLKKIKKAGCVLVRYGVESGSQKIIDSMNKQLYVTEMEQILRDAHNAGIWNHINLMTGYLYETEEDIEQTINFVKRNKDYIDSVRINPFYIPIDSPIYNNPEAFNIKIIENTGSCVKFTQNNMTWSKKKKEIENSTKRILDLCKKLDINFAGILPNLVSTALAYFKDINKTKKWLKEKHPYLWEPLSPDTAKLRLAHPELSDISINEWDQISGERGLNYLTKI